MLTRSKAKLLGIVDTPTSRPTVGKRAKKCTTTTLKQTAAGKEHESSSLNDNLPDERETSVSAVELSKSDVQVIESEYVSEEEETENSVIEISNNSDVDEHYLEDNVPGFPPENRRISPAEAALRNNVVDFATPSDRKVVLGNKMPRKNSRSCVVEESPTSMRGVSLIDKFNESLRKKKHERKAAMSMKARKSLIFNVSDANVQQSSSDFTESSLSSLFDNNENRSPVLSDLEGAAGDNTDVSIDAEKDFDFTESPMFTSTPLSDKSPKKRTAKIEFTESPMVTSTPLSDKSPKKRNPKIESPGDNKWNIEKAIAYIESPIKPLPDASIEEEIFGSENMPTVKKTPEKKVKRSRKPKVPVAKEHVPVSYQMTYGHARWFYVVSGCAHGSKTFNKAQHKLGHMFTGYVLGHNFYFGAEEKNMLKNAFLFNAQSMLHTRKYRPKLVTVRYHPRNYVAVLPVSETTTVGNVLRYVRYLFDNIQVRDRDIQFYIEGEHIEVDLTCADIWKKYGQTPWYMFVCPGPHEWQYILPALMDAQKYEEETGDIMAWTNPLKFLHRDGDNDENISNVSMENASVSH